MPVNFGLLQPVQPASAFFQGQQDVRAEQERNMLRAAQMEQMAFQRENMMAQRQERAAHAQQRMQEEAESKRRREALDKAAEVLGKAGANLDLPTLNQGLAFALQSGNTVAAQTMSKLRDDFVAQARYEQEQQRIFGGGAPAGAAPAAMPAGAAPANAMATGPAPSIMRQAPTTAAPAPAPAAPVNMLAGTFFDIGLKTPAPVATPPANALVAPPAAAATLPPGITRERVQQMIMSRSPEMQAQGRALAATLEKEAKTPTELEVMQQLGFPLTKEGYTAFQATKKQPAPSTTVVIPPQEKEERGARGKLLVKQYEGVAEAARIAGRTLPALETQEQVLDSGFKTGFGTEAQKAGASLLSALGVPEANKFATDAQKFLSATQQAVLQRQLEQKGPQTEADAQRITQTGAQLGNTPDANKFIISVAKAQLKRDIEQRNFYDKWWKENKTYDGAEDAWLNGEGGKSLFARPELKQYAAPAKAAPAPAPAAATGVQPFSDAEKERRYQEWKRSRGKP